MILTSHTPEFNQINGKEVFDYYFQNAQKNKFNINLEQLREMFFKNQRFQKSKKKINKKLNYIAKSYGLSVKSKQKLICPELFKCDGITNNGFKVFSDYGHFTLKGAKFLGERMKKQIGWVWIIIKIIALRSNIFY